MTTTSETKTPLTDQIAALSTSVISIDGARRVGWAKAFAALRQLETVSHDYNVAEGDRVIFREKTSFLMGYMEKVLREFGTPGNFLWADLRDRLGLASDVALWEDALLDQGQVRVGRDHATNRIEALGTLDHDAVRDPAAWLMERAQRRALKRELNDLGEDQWSPEQKAAHRKTLLRQEAEKIAARMVHERTRQEAVADITGELGFISVVKLRKFIGNRIAEITSRDQYDAVKARVTMKLMKKYGLKSPVELDQALEHWGHCRHRTAEV